MNKNYSQKPVGAPIRKINPEPEQKNTILKTGLVSNCFKLNIREEPSAESLILCEISKSDKVTVYESDSVDDFYKVKTSSGIEGYCMNGYITIQK